MGNAPTTVASIDKSDTSARSQPPVAAMGHDSNIFRTSDPHRLYRVNTTKRPTHAEAVTLTSYPTVSNVVPSQLYARSFRVFLISLHFFFSLAVVSKWHDSNKRNDESWCVFLSWFHWEIFSKLKGNNMLITCVQMCNQTIALPSHKRCIRERPSSSECDSLRCWNDCK